jgi:hypothetical protein
MAPEFNPAGNHFDQMSKYTARLRPEAFFRWLLKRRDRLKRFGGWLPEQAIPYPGAETRICDCAAHMTDELRHGVPWAIVVEFKSEPDIDVIDQVGIYGHYIRKTVFPQAGQKGRYRTAGIVVNLTGVQPPYEDDIYEDIPQLSSTSSPMIVNLSTYSASETLREIEAGDCDLCILPWVALMQGAEEADIIEWWKRLAATEEKSTFRSDYAIAAEVFANAAGCYDVWAKALEGWNVTESLAVKKYIAMGETKGLEKGVAQGLEKGLTQGLEQGDLIGQIRTYQELLGETPDQRAVLATKSLGELEQFLAQIKAKFSTKA